MTSSNRQLNTSGGSASNYQTPTTNVSMLSFGLTDMDDYDTYYKVSLGIIQRK